MAGGAARPVASATDEDAGPVADDNAEGLVARGGDATWLNLQDFPQLDKDHVLAIEMQINP